MNRRLIDRLMGRDQDLLTLAVRFVLLPLSLLYLVVVTIRNALYDNGLLSTQAVGVPVVSVGNLTVGGTGKTPLVIALARKGAAEGRKVAIVCRGYGAVADDDGHTDEVALLMARCPQATVIMVPDKLSGARQAAASGADLILVDDGFQHRRLHRDLDLVVMDARTPFGNGDVLPAGSLREPPSGLERADFIVVTHHDHLDRFGRESLLARLQAHRRGVGVIWARHEPTGVRTVGGDAIASPDSLAGQDVFLFAGIASPEGFRRTVESVGASVTGLLAFPDHHDFDPGDLAAVRAQARTSALLCTEKDAVKIARIPDHGDVRCLVVELAFESELPSLPTPADIASAAGEDDDHH